MIARRGAAPISPEEADMHSVQPSAEASTLRQAAITSDAPPLPGFASGGGSAARFVIDDAVGQVFGIEGPRLRAGTRGRKNVALARQVGMYIAHVGLGCTYTEVGRVFGRDRTTVAHACALIEDRRDEPSFDLALQCLEGVVRHQMAARGLRATAAQTHFVG